MRRVIFIASVFICGFLCGCTQKNAEEYTKTVFAMDTVMDLKIYAENDEALSKAETEIKRIELMIDRGIENSEIYKINENKSADISSETADVIRAALSISKRTDGAFDITVAPIIDLWGFYGNEFKVPTDDKLNSVLANIGYENIQLDKNNISIPENTEIDLGGIGKGYTSDCVVDVLKSNGVKSAIISLGGNVHALGKRKDGSLWKVGIADPQDTTKYVGKLNVSDKAVITSGGYQRFFEKDGVIYHHIINPKTGKSANSGLLSVTIISDSGITADGLSTSLFVMGLEKSTELWRESKDFEAVFVDNSDKIYVTSGLVNSFETDREYEIIE